MPDNAFSSEYAGAAPTQAAMPPVVPTRSARTQADTKQLASIDEELGFKITPIPMTSGKPRRVIIRGKVTRD